MIFSVSQPTKRTNERVVFLCNILQCYKSVVIRIYLDKLQSLYGAFLALIKYCHKRGTQAFDFLEVVPWKRNTDLQDGHGNFIAPVEDDWFEMTFSISLL